MNYLEAVMDESTTLPEYRKHLRLHAWCIPTISAQPILFLQFGVCSSLHRLIKIATRGVMEILGLDPYQSETQYLEELFRVSEEWRQRGYTSPLRIQSASTFYELVKNAETKQIHVSTSKHIIPNKYKRITMPGKPFQSSLIPYQNEIATLRSSKPPVSYARIAVMLREKHGLSVQRAAIAKFVKVRSGGRKVYFFRKDIAAKKSVHPQPVERLGHAGSGPAVASNLLQQQPPKPKFEFTYSERYNLHRLPPEEAAARRKKLEAEGH